MADAQTLAAEARERAGKGTARAARRAGRVPAIIYGNKEAPLAITIERRLIDKALGTPGFYTSLVDIEVDGATHKVLPRDTQMHAVTGAPLHVDFLRFDPNRKITAEVPVNFINEREAPGITRGGVINIVRHTVEVSCSAANIPDEFEIDLTGLEIGDSIHASTIALPEGVEFTITDRDFTVATIAAPTIMTAEEEEEGEMDEEDMEGVEGEEGAEGAEGEEGDGGDAEEKSDD